MQEADGVNMEALEVLVSALVEFILEESEAVAAAVVKLQAVTKQHVGASSPSPAALAAASAVLEDAVAAAMQAYGRWRLGVLLLHLVATFTALTTPSHLLPGHPEQVGPGWEDTCLAYLLLQQQRDDGLPVSDWFGLFCQAQGVQGLGGDCGEDAGTAAPAEEILEGPNRRRAVVARARAGRKARGYAEARVWKATKRRRLTAVQRVFAPECHSSLTFGTSQQITAGWDHTESLPDYDYGSD
eukprot:gene12874-13000_t